MLEVERGVGDDTGRDDSQRVEDQVGPGGGDQRVVGGGEGAVGYVRVVSLEESCDSFYDSLVKAYREESCDIDIGVGGYDDDLGPGEYFAIK